MSAIDLRLQLDLNCLACGGPVSPASASPAPDERWARLKTQLEWMAGAKGVAAYEVARDNELDPDDLKAIELVDERGSRANRPRLLFKSAGSDFWFQVTPGGLKRARMAWAGRD